MIVLVRNSELETILEKGSKKLRLLRQVQLFWFFFMGPFLAENGFPIMDCGKSDMLVIDSIICLL